MAAEAAETEAAARVGEARVGEATGVVPMVAPSAAWETVATETEAAETTPDAGVEVTAAVTYI